MNVNVVLSLLFLTACCCQVQPNDVKLADNQVGQRGANVNTTSNTRQYDTAMRNILKTVSIIVIMFFICSSPSQFLWLMANLGLITIDLGGWAYYMCTLTQFCNVCINPLIYAIKYKDFGSGCNRMIRKVLSHQLPIGKKIATISVMSANTNMWQLY
jgi:hypothetical protein